MGVIPGLWSVSHNTRQQYSEMAGDSFRDAAWDNQLDNMLDDLQNSVQSGETHGYKNGFSSGGGHTSRQYEERQNGNTREVREKVTRVAGGPGEGFSYREESQFMSSSSSSHTPMMGSKKAVQNGHMEQHMIDEQHNDFNQGMRGRSDSLVSDLSSIAKVRSVSKTSTSNFSSSQSRYEYTSSSTQQQNNQSSSNTQQSIKKNINDLDNLLSNLSSHNSGAASRTSSKPASREASPGRGRAGGYQGYSSSHMTRTMRSNVSGVSSEFRPVHTTPDPLTGRYADGRITPNHGYTRNFTGSSPMPPCKATVPTSGDVIGIPKKPDELLSSLGHSVDSREIQRITQEETVVQNQKEKEQRALKSLRDEDFIPTKNVAGPPVFYPQGDLYTKNKEDVKAREAELSAQGQYFSASYAAERGSKSKEETGEKGGAAVIPICLPLCCAAPCVIM